jgi:trehalose 6-phosphate phosphatase
LVGLSLAEAVALLSADPSSTCVVTDFDGTLAQVVPNPDLARPLPGVAEVLARLASSYGTVAVVSGRPAAFLARHLLMVGTGPAPQLIGLYGLESVGPEGSVVTEPAAEPWRGVVAKAAEEAGLSLGHPTAVERKGLTVTLHWRRRPELEARVLELAAQLAGETGLIAHPAKMSVELRPPLEVDKGTAVSQLVAGYAAACFLGDDLGDLPAFAVLAGAQAGGLRAVRIAVASDETPIELLNSADLVVGGPAGALTLLRSLVV